MDCDALMIIGVFGHSKTTLTCNEGEGFIRCQRMIVHKGAYIKYVGKILQIFDPRPPP